MQIKILISFVLFISAFIKPQSDLQRQFEYAEKLQTEENYFDAVTEYNRLVLFDTLELFTYKAYSSIAMCYYQGAKYSEAIDYLSKALTITTDKKEKFSTSIEVVKCNLLRRTPASALRILDELAGSGQYTGNIAEINYWRGWYFIFMDEWASASNAFGISDSNSSLKKFCLDVENKKYHVSFVKLISAIVPGSGQIYTGEYLNGILSLGWNVLFTYLIIDAIRSKRELDAILIGNLLWLRFYNGNLQTAERFANDQNRIITNEALRYLQKDFQGEKP